MTASPRKFLFDVSFDAAEGPSGSLRDVPATRADVEAARAAGIAAGREEALAEAAQRAETHAARALETLTGGIGALFAARDQIAQEIEREAVALLRAVLHKAVPVLCRKDPLGELEAMVAHCLAEAIDEPRLVVRVGEAVFDAMQPRLSGIAEAVGFAGKIVLLADASLGPGDARVEWADGGAERDLARIAHEIDAVLARAMPAPTPAPHAAPEETLNV